MCRHILAAYFRGFHGDYQAELMRGDEVLVTKNLTLVAGQTTEITLAVPWYFKLSNTESQISFPRQCSAFLDSDFPYNVYFQFFVVFCVFFRSQGLTQVPHVLDNCSSKVGVSQLPALLGGKDLEWGGIRSMQCYLSMLRMATLSPSEGSRAQHKDKEKGTRDFHR